MQQECEHNIEGGAARPYSIVISLVLDCGWLRCDWPNPEKYRCLHADELFVEVSV